MGGGREGEMGGREGGRNGGRRQKGGSSGCSSYSIGGGGQMRTPGGVGEGLSVYRGMRGRRGFGAVAG